MGTVEDARRGAGRIYGALTGPEVPSPRPRSRSAGPDRVRTIVRTAGEILITLGVVVLLFVVYEVYVTDVISAGKQQDATEALDDQWQTTEPDQERVDHFDGLQPGEGFAKMYIPAFGTDFHFTIVEGTSDKALEIGPGHYLDTPYPGQPGNFAVAGHRVGKGAPFNDLDLLTSCDAIIVESRNAWYIYRVLPMKDEAGRWEQVKQDKPRCNVTGSQGRAQQVEPLKGEYTDTHGMEIVRPSEGAVIADVPHKPNAKVNKADQVALLTLTTCHPKFSDRQRLIVHATLVDQWAKNPDQPDSRPAELKEG
ncbi:MAG TPA: class E sortase [Actinophytocola sp.]|uniref:class E sortase n=1 Tax=Actinophytocola sp. TaxID=1872138 RepID=UPI002DB6A270|nr:class E sortase [Actinophytocola sp.]HEU5473147.1 class E sortase [Actinophytocola sp.]